MLSNILLTLKISGKMTTDIQIDQLASPENYNVQNMQQILHDQLTFEITRMKGAVKRLEEVVRLKQKLLEGLNADIKSIDREIVLREQQLNSKDLPWILTITCIIVACLAIGAKLYLD